MGKIEVRIDNAVPVNITVRLAVTIAVKVTCNCIKGQLPYARHGKYIKPALSQLCAKYVQSAVRCMSARRRADASTAEAGRAPGTRHMFTLETSSLPKISVPLGSISGLANVSVPAFANTNAGSSAVALYAGIGTHSPGTIAC